MKAIHVFDGFGGLRRGFEQAGIETVERVEITDGKDIKTYKGTCGMADILAGGPPCVHTSAAGRLSGVKTNQSIWPEMLRVCKEGAFKWVFVEQPASVDKNIIATWCEDLQRLGYGVAGRIIDAKHWVPQQRPRWYLIGRMGTTGLALWYYLYSDGQRSERRRTKGRKGKLYVGSCPDCMPGGILSRVSQRGIACVGAGNAVPVPVARWFGEKLKEIDSRFSVLIRGFKI